MTDVYTVKNMPTGDRDGLGAHFTAVILGPIKPEAAVKISSKDLIWASTKLELWRKLEEKFPKTAVELEFQEFRHCLSRYQEGQVAADFGFGDLGVPQPNKVIVVLNIQCLPATTTPEEVSQAAKHGDVLVKVDEREGRGSLFKRLKLAKGLKVSPLGYGYNKTYIKVRYDLEAWEADRKHEAEDKDKSKETQLRPVDASARLVHALRSEMADLLKKALWRKMLGSSRTPLAKLSVSDYKHIAGYAAIEAYQLLKLGKRVFGSKFWDGKILKCSTWHYGRWNKDPKISYKRINDGPIIKSIRDYQVKKHARYPGKNHKAARLLWELVWMYEPEKLKKLKKGAKANEV